MIAEGIKLVCKDMATHQMHFPCRFLLPLNYSESVECGGAEVGGERQGRDRSAATVKLIPTAGREYLFLASTGAAFRTELRRGRVWGGFERGGRDDDARRWSGGGMGDGQIPFISFRSRGWLLFRFGWVGFGVRFRFVAG